MCPHRRKEVARLMNLPKPLPGTHLARVDCAECGRYVLSVPEYADKALCTGCGLDKAKALASEYARAFVED